MSKLSWFFLKNRPTPASFSIIFGRFKQTIQFYNKSMWKMSCPSRIWCRDSNPWPLEHESPPITTRPGLPFMIIMFIFVIFKPQKWQQECPWHLTKSLKVQNDALDANSQSCNLRNWNISHVNMSPFKSNVDVTFPATNVRMKFCLRAVEIAVNIMLERLFLFKCKNSSLNAHVTFRRI